MEDAGQEMQRLLGEAQPPSASDLTLDGRPLDPNWVIGVLAPYLTGARRARIEDVLDGRTYTVATVVEGLVNTGNVSAVMRSAEALGFGSFHVVTGEGRYKTSKRTSQGAEKWLDVFGWETPTACARHLKASGYAVVATHLDKASVPIGEIDFTRKTALVFGNEQEGISAEMAALADRRCLIPMPGFTQSFNISVAAAVALYHARQDRLARQGFHGDLGDAVRTDVRARFYWKRRPPRRGPPAAGAGRWLKAARADVRLRAVSLPTSAHLLDGLQREPAVVGEHEAAVPPPLARRALQADVDRVLAQGVHDAAGEGRDDRIAPDEQPRLIDAARAEDAVLEALAVKAFVDVRRPREGLRLVFLGKKAARGQR